MICEYGRVRASEQGFFAGRGVSEYTFKYILGVQCAHRAVAIFVKLRLNCVQRAENMI